MRTANRYAAALLVVGLSAGQALVACPTASAQELKLGYVNLGKVFDQYQRTKDSEVGLEQRGKQKEAQLQAQLEEIKKLRDGLELLNDQSREGKTRELEEKSDRFKRTKEQSERELVTQRNQLAKQILDEIGQAVAEYGKANGFTLIFDQRSLLYGQDSYEVTDKIVQILNDRYAAKVKKPAAKPAQ